MHRSTLGEHREAGEPAEHRAAGGREWSGGNRNLTMFRLYDGLYDGKSVQALRWEISAVLGFTMGNQCSVLGRGGTGSILIGSFWYQC